LKDIVVLKSAEVDILEDGSLDYSDAALKELDFTICSIHSRFVLDREKQTERIMRAMDRPFFHILGHATGRLLLKRDEYELDWNELSAMQRNVAAILRLIPIPIAWTCLTRMHCLQKNTA
jgi:DNA polymerase (family 10)